MKLNSFALILTLACAAAVHRGEASLIEGFETALPGGSTIGDAALVDSSFFTPSQPPPQGTKQLLLTTLAEASDGGNYSGIDAVSVASAESFLSLQTGSIPSEGSLGDVSAVKFTLTLNAGEIATFQYQFLTNWEFGDGDDFGFYTLQLGSSTPIFNPFTTASQAMTASDSALFNRNGAVMTFSTGPVALSGTYTLGIGLAEHTDDAVQSGLLVDNIQVVDNVPALPEFCHSFALFGLASLGLALFRRSSSVAGL